MKKSETLNNYLQFYHLMEGLLSNMKVNFRKEVKDIIGITQEDIEKLSVKYIDNNTKIALFYEIKNPYLLKAFKKMDEDYDDEAIRGILVKADFVTETYSDLKFSSKPYIDMIKIYLISIDNELSALNTEKEILINKSKNFIWKLFHPKVETAIYNINTAIEEVEKVKNTINEEKESFENDGIINKIVKSFVEAVKITYGIDIKLMIGEM